MADLMLNRHSREDRTKAQSALNVQRTGEANNLDSTSSESLITQHIDIWTTAIERKSSAGRGTSNKFSLYGIKKLRELILELAVRGKLVPQDANDKPAFSILNHPQVLKRRVIKLGKGKVIDVGRNITDMEKSYALPHGWEWARLGKVIEVIGGSQPPKSKFAYEPQEGFVRLVQIRDFKSDTNLTYVSAEFANRPFKETDIMIGRYGPPVFQILRGLSGTYNVALMKAEPIAKAFSNDYLFWLLSEPVIQKLIVSESERTAGQSGVRKELIYDFVIGLPPYEEQLRIVAKVDELMSLCDALEAQTEASIAAHQTLVETLLNALLLPNIIQQKDSQSASPESSFTDSLEPALNESFVESWQRVAEHFDTLFTTAASIDTLKQTILQLAVMGKLVQQDASDEPAAKLLERIKAEKAQLIKNGKIKKQKPLPAITDEEKPFELPRGWEWCRLPDLGELARGKSKHRPRNDPKLYQDGTIPLVQTGDVARSSGIIETYTAQYNEVGLAQSQLWPKGTLCITIAANIADTAILGFDACFPDSVVGYTPFDSKIPTKYFDYFIRTAKANLERFAPSTAQKNINLEILSQVLVPCPPEQEFKRVVARIDELMALCDQLKTRLSDAQTTQLHLTDAIVELAI
jgi:type I restriction enzyme S subunit